MLKELSIQFAKSIVVLFVLAIAILGIMFLTDNFRIDTDAVATFGIYDSSLSELPAYYNPGIQTLEFIEMVSLFSLPVALLAGRIFIKSLRGVPTKPWIVVAVAVMFAVFTWPLAITQGNDSYDPLVSSQLPYFLQAQIPLTLALAAGYGLSALRLRKTSTSRPE